MNALVLLGIAGLLEVGGAACAAAEAPLSEAWVCEGDEMPLTTVLRSEYDERFASCAVRQERRAEVERIVTRIMKSRARYEQVAAAIGVPWHVIAVIHNMECSGNFRCHLHNGDPLTARTTHVPAGRPAAGKPPFTWEESAIDALQIQAFDVWPDWSVAGTLFKLEAFNGTGYRRRGVPSPYLWSGSQHYIRGKYVADGRFDPTAVSRQVGAAVLLRRMHDQALIELSLGRDAKCEGVR